MADGKRPSRQTRAERQAMAAQAQRRRQLRVRAAIAVGVALAVAVVAVMLASGRRDRDQKISSLETGTCNFDTRSDGDLGAGRNHVTRPVYKVNPPAGGDHLAQAASAGDYTGGGVVVPPDGQLVHSMEHGYVVVWVRPEVDEIGLAALKGVYQRHARDVLLVPRESLPVPAAATAWHERLLCEAPDAEAIERFVQTYANQGPEKVAH